MTPTGLVSVGPAVLRRIIALSALLAVVALTMLALIAQPRGGWRDRSARAPTETTTGRTP